jgi:uncharacterized protein YegP (UPF0339 family)
MAKYEIYEADGWRWQLIDDNGEPVANSEPYTTRESAERGARNIQATAPNADIVLREAASGPEGES